MNTKERKGYVRFTFFAPQNIGAQIKESAVMENKTITGYILDAVLEKFIREREIKCPKVKKQ